MPAEVVRETLLALQALVPLWIALLGVAAVFLGAEWGLWRGLGRPWQRRLRVLLLVAAAAGGLFFAWKTLFLCDDAYISFRYAQNLVEGHGLVWNEGEWVEGYTNFLWTVMLAGASKLGADIPLTALFGNLATFVLALFVAATAVRRAAPKDRPPIVPFAAIALAASTAFQTFASSGLETMPGALCVAAAFLPTSRRPGALWSGLALTAAAMMRPDHVLFYGAFALAIVVEDLIHRKEETFFRRLDWARYALYAAPLLLIYVPYYLLRWRAYGDFFPNTYYAKSADLAYWKQGWVYLLHFTGSSGAWIWLPLFFAALFFRPIARQETRARVFALLAVPVFGLYVTKVGGDFMEHRFFVPALPVVAIGMEIALRWRARRRPLPGTPRSLHLFRRGLLWTAVAAAFGTAALPVHLIPPNEIRWSISPEPSFYRVKSISPLSVETGWFSFGKKLGKEMADRGVRPPIGAAAIGIVGYYSRFPVIDVIGLTNRAIAHKIIGRRGRPGHEKLASLEELIEQGAVLDVGPKYNAFFTDMIEGRVSDAKFYFTVLDPKWTAAIAALPRSKVPDPEKDLEQMLRTATRDKLLLSIPFYKSFLRRHPLRDPILAKVREQLGTIADFEEGIPDAITVTGRGIAWSPSPPPAGVSGTGYVGSLPDAMGGTGKMVVPLGVIDTDEVRFRLGGAQSDDLSVSLVVEGQEVDRATPSGTTAMVPMAFWTGHLRGLDATLVIEDADPQPGMGLFVDAIHVPPKTRDVRTRIAAYDPNKPDELADLIQDAEAVLPEGDPDREALLGLIVARWTLDTLPEGTTVTGKAFGKGPVDKALRNQQPVRGNQGKGFLNSYHGGDSSTGRVELPMMDLQNVRVVVRVAGGRDCKLLHVAIESAGKQVVRVCGKDDEFLRAEVLRTPAGVTQGRIVIEDQSTGGWGHIVADDIIVMRTPGSPRF